MAHVKRCDRCGQIAADDDKAEQRVAIEIDASDWDRRRRLSRVGVSVLVEAVNRDQRDTHGGLEICRACMKLTILELALALGVLHRIDGVVSVPDFTR